MNKILNRLFYPTRTKRIIFFILSDVIIYSFSIIFGALLRFEFRFAPILYYKTQILYFGVLSISLKLFLSYLMKLYDISWRYVSLRDLYNLVKINLTATFLMALTVLFLYHNIFHGFPRSLIVLDFILSVSLSSVLRISKRLYLEILPKTNHKKGKRAIIIGAGNTGEMIIRELIKNNYQPYNPVAILDSDPRTHNTYIHNIKVFGDIDIMEEIIKRLKVEAVIIAIPTIAHKFLREITKKAKKANIKEIKIIPRLYSLQQKELDVKSLEDIKIEDLLKREEIKINYKQIERFIKGKRLLITGASGSIGSEISKQVSAFSPEKLILLDIDETGIFNIERRLKQGFPELKERIVPIVGDIRNYSKLELIFSKYRPQIVFHSAAYKHVPLMELNPDEAIRTNIFGTYNLCEISDKFAVETFVFISTDKAVNPTNIMGASKRLGEYICSAFNKASSTEYISVRFGNVLGSRGSVLPIFMEQLKKGGPITVTHPEMKRYFMTIPEAVSLVLQAATIGKGGQVLVLDMGKPVKIYELAQELIRLHGLEPGEDIEIVFTGVRPGEKLFEELLTAEEGTDRTTHEKIFIARISTYLSLEDVKEALGKFESALRNMEFETLKEIFKQYIPTYNPTPIFELSVDSKRDKVEIN